MKNLFPYIYDFLSLLLGDNKMKSKIKRIILFGSVARGEADEESDIDVFIDVWSKHDILETKEYVKDAEKRFYVISEKKWSLLGITQPITCIVGILDDGHWKSLRSEIISGGYTLFGKFEEKEEGWAHYAMINYSLSALKQAKKMKLLRKLFGYAVKKGRKKYVQYGIVEGTGGVKLSSNVLLIPVEKSRDVIKILNSSGVTAQIRDTMVKE
ncbi:MAG: nucleotidyltransferase domain-containing protein [Candidatus Aenigmarchaeota archaeon]|nr:nucleotidyltransferase domain-containing protein [Candidatus Aenigmarchaeota archaeon]